MNVLQSQLHINNNNLKLVQYFDTKLMLVLLLLVIYQTNKLSAMKPHIIVSFGFKTIVQVFSFQICLDQ